MSKPPSTMQVNLKYIVFLVFFIPIITIATTYTITIVKDDSTQLLPFISGTINYPPESCIGTFGLSIASSIIMLLNVIRLVYVRAWVRRTGITPHDSLERLNIAGAIFGFIFAFGLVGVISFQYHFNHRIHNSFAGSLFLAGTIYMCLQALMDWMMHKKRESSRRFVLYLRITCAIGGCLLYIPLAHDVVANYGGCSGDHDIIYVLLFLLFISC